MAYQASSQNVLSHEYHKGGMVGIVVKGIASSNALNSETRRFVYDFSVTRAEPPRVDRRLQLLRVWSHEQTDNQ